MIEQLSFLPMIYDAEHASWLLNGMQVVKNDCGVYVDEGKQGTNQALQEIVRQNRKGDKVMSGLKVYKMVDEKYCDDSFCVIPSDVYLKSEADEELEKLNRQVEFLQTTHSSCNECNKCADGMGRVFDENLDEPKKEKAYLLEHTTEVINSQERVIHHQKYKRCLAMAKWCNERWILDDCLYELGKTRFYERWEKRWLKIAEQFKEDNK